MYLSLFSIVLNIKSMFPSYTTPYKIMSSLPAKNVLCFTDFYNLLPPKCAAALYAVGTEVDSTQLSFLHI